ncbi:branched-chain amino acid transporter permease [Enorma phocaeensis]|uniref:branched-chain amino acid transporter permease n=1 Tax=Enorma phocaeensis TaxID=1871019 RepID=UPI002354B2CE|nr:AzlD domain-containing protein [Enorma phocaeensis]
MTTLQMIVTIAVAAAATVLTRALPFFAFPAGRETPRYIRYLGGALPGAAFGLLVVYCLRDVSLFSGSHAVPELVSIFVTGALYLWRRNMLLSIFAGTGIYMVLVNFIFI